MTATTFDVAPGAKLPLSLLSATEKRKLAELVSPLAEVDARRTKAGHFVSRLGNSKRVLWERESNGPARILSIVDSSYQPAQ